MYLNFDLTGGGINKNRYLAFAFILRGFDTVAGKQQVTSVLDLFERFRNTFSNQHLIEIRNVAAIILCFFKLFVFVCVPTKVTALQSAIQSKLNPKSSRNTNFPKFAETFSSYKLGVVGSTPVTPKNFLAPSQRQG